MPEQDDTIAEDLSSSPYEEHTRAPHDGGYYADGPRARLGQSSADYADSEARPARGGRGVLSSLLGHDPATRKLMGCAGAIIVVLLLVGGGWSLFGHRQQGIAVIGPPAFPVKDRPADPGGMQIMSDDTANSDVTGKGTVHLAPPPEQPDTRVLARREGETTQDGGSSQGGTAAPTQAADGQSVSRNAPAGNPSTASQPSSRDSEGQGQTAEKDVSSGSEAKEASAKEAKPSSDVHASTLPPPQASSSSPSEESGSSDASSEEPKATHRSYQVQLAALDNEAQAARAWKSFSAKAPEILGGRTPHYQSVSRGGKNFVRLRVEGFHDFKEARLFCARLHAQSLACSPVAF